MLQDVAVVHEKAWLIKAHKDAHALPGVQRHGVFPAPFIERRQDPMRVILPLWYSCLSWNREGRREKRLDTERPAMSKKCGCCGDESSVTPSTDFGEYICYCNKVTEQDIKHAINDKGAASVEQVIEMTGAMVNSNCKVNNPKGTCCYPDILQVFARYRQ